MDTKAHQQTRLLKLPCVLKKFPVSRSKWYAGIKSGDYPAGIKLGERSVAWRESDIDSLIGRISHER